MKLIDCEACGHDNMFIEHRKMVCRVCGGKQNIPLSIPNLKWIKEVIWQKAGKDLEHVKFHTTLFRLSDKQSQARQNSIFYNILVYMTHGKRESETIK
jgi:hypothetical protein